VNTDKIEEAVLAIGSLPHNNNLSRALPFKEVLLITIFSFGSAGG
jgi:hypothetical protein